MKLPLALAALFLGLTPAACTTMQPIQQHRQGSFKVAITIDDVPILDPLPPGVTALDVNRQMVDAIKTARVTGVSGFVNGARGENPEFVAALNLWRNAGILLGNHTWSHPNLNGQTVEAFQEEIARNEPLLNSLNRNPRWRWFRFPFLAEGEDPAKRAAIRAYLAQRGYRIASVSMDFSDWKFTAAYARCMAAGDGAAIRRMEALYLAAAYDHIAYSRNLTKRIYGRDIPLVLLMHIDAFSAHMMPRLIELYREAGAEFVSLAEAQTDAAYDEDNDPRLPPRSQFIAERARLLGVSAAPPPDPAPELEAFCVESRPPASIR